MSRHKSFVIQQYHKTLSRGRLMVFDCALWCQHWFQSVASLVYYPYLTWRNNLQYFLCNTFLLNTNWRVWYEKAFFFFWQFQFSIEVCTKTFPFCFGAKRGNLFLIQGLWVARYRRNLPVIIGTDDFLTTFFLLLTNLDNWKLYPSCTKLLKYCAS